MKRRRIIVCFVAVCSVGIVFMLWLRPVEIPPSANTTESSSTETASVASNEDLSEPRLSRPAAAVEGTRQVIAAQKWARKHNAPVAFYAKVIDQHGVPIAGVTLTIRLTVWNDSLLAKDRIEESVLQIESNSAGEFDLKRDKGAWLRIEQLEKEGFLWRDHGLSAIGYGMNAPAGGPTFATPQQRLILHVWRKGMTDSLIQHGIKIRLSERQETYGVNLFTGQKVGPGEFADLLIRIPLVEDAAGAARGERWLIFETPNGGIIETTDFYPYAPPSEGYLQQWKWLREIGKAGSEQWRKNFYLTLRSGRVFGGLTVTWGVGSASFEINALVNPNGTTALEPDPQKFITSAEEIQRLDTQNKP